MAHGNPEPPFIALEGVPDGNETARVSKAGKVPVFPPPADFAYLEGVIKEQFKRSYAKVVLLPLASAAVVREQGQVEIDPLYGTVREVQVDGKRVEFDVNAYVKVEPSKQILKRFGIDEQRDILVSFQLSELAELGLVTKERFRGIDIGWIVVFDETKYSILSAHRAGYYGNTGLAHLIVATADRYRENNNPGGL